MTFFFLFITLFFSIVFFFVFVFPFSFVSFAFFFFIAASFFAFLIFPIYYKRQPAAMAIKLDGFGRAGMVEMIGGAA